MNPLVGTILEAHCKADHPLYMARQPCQRVGDLAPAGISAFAFQGTNAHAVLSAVHTPSQPSPAIATAALTRRRMWYSAVAPHRMLQTASAEKGDALLISSYVHGAAEECEGGFGKAYWLAC